MVGVIGWQSVALLREGFGHKFLKSSLVLLDTGTLAFASYLLGHIAHAESLDRLALHLLTTMVVCKVTFFAVLSFDFPEVDESYPRPSAFHKPNLGF